MALLGFEVVGAMVAGVGEAVDPGGDKKKKMRKVVEGIRKLAPTSIIPHTSATAGGGESGANLLAGFVLAVVSDPLSPAWIIVCPCTYTQGGQEMIEKESVSKFYPHQN